MGKELDAARGFVVLVASSPSSPSSESGSTFQERPRYDDAALAVELDDLAAYGEALVIGRFAVVVLVDRRDRHVLMLAATLRSPREDLRVARRQYTDWFPMARLTFRILFRGRRLKVEFDRNEATYTLLEGPPLLITHHGERVEIPADAALTKPVPASPVRAAPMQPTGREPARRKS